MNPAASPVRSADAAGTATAGGGCGREGLVRWLALLKLRELRRMGLTLREIGLRYARPGETGITADRLRVTPRAVLAPPNADAAETAVLVRALDATEHGVAFFSPRGALLHANRRFHEIVAPGRAGAVGREVCVLARSVGAIARIRGLPGDEGVTQELVVQLLGVGNAVFRLRGSYLGVGLFGRGSSVLVSLERAPEDPLRDERLKERFGLTPQERRVLRLLVNGRSNQEVAHALSISPHTARHHTERVLAKLGVRSRAEVLPRVLRGEPDEN
jgi:DNA-binding CsgD family transcriptional regulator